MTPYIVYLMVCVALLIIFTIVGVIFMSAIPVGAIVFAFIMIFAILLNIYFASVIKSHRDEVCLGGLGFALVRLSWEM